MDCFARRGTLVIRWPSPIALVHRSEFDAAQSLCGILFYHRWTVPSPGCGGLPSQIFLAQLIFLSNTKRDGEINCIIPSHRHLPYACTTH
jgi:hypothetical protein